MFLHACDMHVQCGAMSATDVTDAEPKDGSHHACKGLSITQSYIAELTDQGHYTDHTDRHCICAYSVTTARMCQVTGTPSISDTGA